MTNTDNQVLVTLTLVDDTRTSFTMSHSDLNITYAYVQVKIDNKIIVTPWHQIKEFVIEEV